MFMMKMFSFGEVLSCLFKKILNGGKECGSWRNRKKCLKILIDKGIGCKW